MSVSKMFLSDLERRLREAQERGEIPATIEIVVLSGATPPLYPDQESMFLFANNTVDRTGPDRRALRVSNALEASPVLGTELVLTLNDNTARTDQPLTRPEGNNHSWLVSVEHEEAAAASDIFALLLDYLVHGFTQSVQDDADRLGRRA
jgi:hypothetical protein